MMRLLLLFPLYILAVLPALKAQQAPSPPNTPATASVEVEHTSEPVVLDGRLEEAVWKRSKPATNFWQNFPTDTLPAQAPTEIYMAYDQQFLYVGVRCRSKGPNYVIPSLRRDYDFWGNDNISLLFDTFNDKTNAFLFGMNPYGVRREAIISNGGTQRTDFEDSWDNRWYGEARINGNEWVAEFAIPFKTLRYQAGSTRWRFNCYRFDAQSSEISSWVRIPRNQIVMNLGFMGEMRWPEALQKPGPNISVIPYSIGGFSRDYQQADQTAPEWTANAGGDAKIAITSGLNLDLTINPDFSQVEVDQQVTNLDRFEIFFPEKRQFFQENADLFGSYGLSRVNPFFSRRIGVGVDTTTGQNFQNPIIFGARLSGKLNERLRVGLLNMQTAKQARNGLPQFNYTVATLQYKVFSRSNFSFIFANKQAVNAQDSEGQFNPYNRVAGIEYLIGDKNNRFRGKAFYHQAFTTANKKDKFSQGFQIEYLRRKYRLEWAHVYVGEGFDAEIGFVPRRDYLLISPEAETYFYPKKGKVSQHTLGFDYRMFFKAGNDGSTLLPRWGLNERQLEVNWEMNFNNSARAMLQFENTYVFLLRDFDPTRIQQDPLARLQAGSSYTYSALSGSFSSDPRKVFSYRLMPTVGQFYNGLRAGLSGSFSLRYQPYGFVSLDYTYNHIRLDAPFEPANLWLIGPRIDLTFSKNVFFTTFIQYNSQLDNLNINARFQWRFQPVSDFFIVYTDNYLADPFSQFSVRNRALVAKLTYWLNL
ncbi:MAG: hypothetical protein D6730_25085 [Bacteroidetes bacterium]|nr:MAG: hypothetical protein D6730_25085 [Bacteroidota bacterium]